MAGNPIEAPSGNPFKAILDALKFLFSKPKK
jgi:hypothetical protein